MYDVWLMTGLKNNRRIASRATLREAYGVVTPKERKEYVYILKWTPMPKQPTSSQPEGEQESTASLLRSRQAVYIWGCICDRSHTNDLRQQVRKVLRSSR
jgi:hypothetical protein